MPNRLYKNADQLLATLPSASDPGTDIVPGNVVKVAFILLSATGFTSVTIITAAAWQTALSASTAEKVVVTPFIDAFEISPTTPLTEGGNDTTTFNGVPRMRSTSYAEGKGKFSGISNDQAKTLRQFAAKSGVFQHGTRLGMILIHEGGGIGALTNGKAIPVYNVFISDPKKGGLGASDDYDFSFHLEGNWSDNQVIFEAAAGFIPASLVNP